MLRDRIARAVPHWARRHARLPRGARHACLRARGDRPTTRAPRDGPPRLELEPRDGWALARGGARDGDAGPAPRGHRLADAATRGLERRTASSPVHNWWHLALFHLGARPVRRGAGAVRRARSAGQRLAVVLDMIDASALLWRLQLRGVDVGDRWDALAAAGQPHRGASIYAFNDMHAMMAFVGAGPHRRCRERARSRRSRRWQPATTTRLQPRRRPAAGAGDHALRRTAATPRPWSCCAACAARATASAAATRSATCIDLTLIEAAGAPARPAWRGRWPTNGWRSNPRAACRATAIRAPSRQRNDLSAILDLGAPQRPGFLFVCRAPHHPGARIALTVQVRSATVGMQNFGGMMRIRLAGDHSSYHCGSAAVVQTIATELRRHGEIVTGDAVRRAGGDSAKARCTMAAALSSKRCG